MDELIFKMARRFCNKRRENPNPEDRKPKRPRITGTIEFESDYYILVETDTYLYLIYIIWQETEETNYIGISVDMFLKI